jgi:hypothetical protein
LSYCSSCSEKNESEDVFCSNCGFNLKSSIIEPKILSEKTLGNHVIFDKTHYESLGSLAFSEDNFNKILEELSYKSRVLSVHADELLNTKFI